ncbi:MAG: dolichyl-phosphate-mannose--protein mannosyltransferase [Ponticaulis sp.]|nr:dolichyl-phosphate-mannose--protein mannosyltransferase [Ponticaulis sp.]
MSIIDHLSKGIRAYLLVFCLTLISAAPGVFTIPALDRDESRFAQASKQMLETDDYIQIRYQDGLRNKKPAGIHWLQVATTEVFSSPEAKDIWSYRLPSLIGVALASCAVFWAGIPLVGRRAAFMGSALFGVCFLLTSEAHIAKTDGVLVAITTLAMASFIHLRTREDHPKWLAILFWFAIGFGFLIKGPVTPMVAALAIVFSELWTRSWKWSALVCAGVVALFLDTYIHLGPANALVGFAMKAAGGAMLIAAAVRFVLDRHKAVWFKTLFWWPGPLLFVLMVLPWFIAVQIATGGQFLEGAVGKDLTDKVAGASEGHGGLPGYHLVFLLVHFFPATLFLLPGLVVAVRDVRRKVSETNGLIFLLAWALPTWLVFEFLPTKLSHYVLPAYPALALVCGYGIWRLVSGERLPVSRYISLGLFLIGGVMFTALISPLGLHEVTTEAAGDFKSVSAETVLASWSSVALVTWPLALVLAGLLAVVVTSVLRKYQLSVALAVLTAVTLGWHIRVLVLPEQTWVQATVAARSALGDICALPGQEGCEGAEPVMVQAIGYAEPSFVFTTGTDVKISPESMSNLPLRDEAPIMAWVINLEDEKGAPALEHIRTQAAEQGRCVRESQPVYALNYSNGDPVHFIALRVEDGPCRA